MSVIDPGQPIITLGMQITEVEREIAMRERVYAKMVERGQMKRWHADSNLAIMRAVLATLKALQAQDQEIRT